MKIKISVGNDQILLRGEQHNFELCRLGNRKDKETGKIMKEWVAYQWFSNLESVFQSLVNMKLRASDAETLGELHNELSTIRNELINHYSTEFQL
jgi:hypothetical protein